LDATGEMLLNRHELRKGDIVEITGFDEMIAQLRNRGLVVGTCT